MKEADGKRGDELRAEHKRSDFGILVRGKYERSNIVMSTEAHPPGKGPKFTRVEMRELKIVAHGDAAVVTCEGTYEGAPASASLRFMRVWLKKGGRWQIIAGSISNPRT